MNSRELRSFFATAMVILAILGATIRAEASALTVQKIIDLNGEDLQADSFDSADPNYSSNGLYPFGDLSKTKANGDVVIISGVLTNSLAVGNAHIKGSLRVGSPGVNMIGPSGAIGDRNWVEGGFPGIQPGHFLNDLNMTLAEATLPITSWLPAVSGSNFIDGVTYKYTFLTNGDYTLPSANGSIFVGTNAQVRLKITGAVNLIGSNGIRITEGAILQVFMTGDSFALGGMGLVNDTGRASAFRYFGLPSNISLTILNNAPFTGTIHAPQAAFSIGGGGNATYDFVGSVTAKAVRLNGHFNFHLDERSALVPPVITTQPRSQFVALGQNAVFNVAVRGGGPRGYQWRLGGIEIAGATTNSLTITNVGPADAGTYSVIVTNSYGTQTSLPATLNVGPTDFLWARSATNGAADPPPFSVALSMAVDASGRPVVAGIFSAPQIDFGGGILTNSPDAANFLSKYDSSGNFVWARKAGASPGSPSPVRVAGDPSGNSWLAAHFIGTANLGNVSLTNGGTADMFITKYDQQGSVLWARQIGAYDSNYENPFGLAVDSNGNCFISSRYQGTANFGTLAISNGSAFLAKYDSAGTLVWAREGPEANAIAVGTNGEVYATGNGFLAKYDDQGGLVWSNAFPTGRAITLDSAQNLFVTGNGTPGTYGGFTLTNTGGFSDFFVAKCDPSGQVLWLRQAGSLKQQAGLGIALDEFGNVYVTAASATKQADPALRFGAVTLSNVMSFVAKYDSGGNGLWAKALATTNWAVAWGIAAPVENVYLGGFFQGTAVFGNFVLMEQFPSIGSAFVARLDGSEPRPVLSLVQAGNQFQLRVTGAAGFRYAVQTSTNLQDWSVVETNVAPFNFLDEGGASAKFYRALFVP